MRFLFFAAEVEFLVVAAAFNGASYEVRGAFGVDASTKQVDIVDVISVKAEDDHPGEIERCRPAPRENLPVVWPLCGSASGPRRA